MHKWQLISSFLVETELPAPFQSGFRAGFGTKTGLVALVDGLRRAMEWGSALLLVLLDWSMTFNTVDHNILLGHLSGMGMGCVCCLAMVRSFTVEDL